MARKSSIGSTANRQSQKMVNFPAFSTLFLLASGIFAAVEEWAPLGFASGIYLADSAVTIETAIQSMK
jgi:hypothetical protein